MGGSLLSLLTVRLVARKDLYRLSQTLSHWCVRLLKRLEIELTIEGVPPSVGLVVSNHLGYLDILVLSAAMPCVFVAKREIKSWPVIGWITTLAGTVYIDRTTKMATHSVQTGLLAALDNGVRVTLFPEGTSSDGKQVLPFHSPLIEAAVQSHAPITAAFISYEVQGGDAALDVCYYGDMVLATHLFRLLRKCNVRAVVRFHPQSKTYTDRKDAARQLREQVLELKDQPAAATSGAVTEPV